MTTEWLPGLQTGSRDSGLLCYQRIIA